MAWDAGACVCAMQPIELLAPFKFLAAAPDHGLVLGAIGRSPADQARRAQARQHADAALEPVLRRGFAAGDGGSLAEGGADSIVENLYGPTELTIACAAYRWDPVNSPAECVNDLVPIGDVYPGLDWVIVDEALAPVGPGAIGELCVAGTQTSPGYWRNPERTAQRFFDRIQPNGSIARYHRTGDLVARRDGGLVFLAAAIRRSKSAVIASNLARSKACCGAAVVSKRWHWPGRVSSNRIISSRSSGASNLPQLEFAARKALPNYMVPRAIHTVAEMPLNANSKIDRNALRRWLASRPEAECTRLAG